MIDQEVYDQACDWIVALDSGSASAADRARFVRWLNRRPQHALAYEEMSQLWARMDTLGGALETDSTLTASTTGPSHHLARWVAGPMVLILAICLYVAFFETGVGGGAAGYFVTAADQYHDVVASDGSRLSMYPGTSLQLAYSADHRKVIMNQGVTDFDVAEDAQRPFTVQAGPVQVKVTGTRFEVGRTAQGVSVRVREGSVAFQVRGVSGSAPIVPLFAGQSVVYRVESDQLVWTDN